MTEQVLKVSNIGKKYDIITNNDNKDTFAAVLLDSLKSSFSKKNKEKGEFWALKNISFNVNKGERIGIIGHNGAGKSTLLKVFSRITVPTEGEIEIRGRIASLLEVGTGFNMELTGRENIYLNGSILGMTKEEIDSKFNDIVEFSEIREFLDVPVKRYSSGMFVKLAFAVASHLDPDILIVDEVLAVGDMKFQEKCLGKMEDVASGGRTVLYVSHSMRTVQQLCNRVIVMNHGKIIYDGDVDEGVRIYMDTNGEIGLHSKFEKQKRHPNVNMGATMIESFILDKDEAKFYENEKLKFSLKWKANRKLENIRLRTEILYTDNTLAGAAFSYNIDKVNKSDIREDKFELDISSLAPGKYRVVLVLCKVGNLGHPEMIDRVEEGLVFEVDYKNGNSYWSHKGWGHVKFPEIKKI